MPKTIQYRLNETQHTEHDLPCQKCAGRTTHKALVTVDVRGSEGDDPHSFEWAIDHQIVQCQGCKSVSFRSAGTGSDDYWQVDEGGYEYAISEKLFPPRIEGRKGLGDDALYLPSTVKLIYEETLTAMSAQAQILSAIGLRALVEAVCKERQAQGADLFKKIDSLVGQRVLTPAGAAILHRIRTLGNAAAHEAKPHNERQLALAMDIVEHMLKDVYILRKKAEFEFSRDA